MGLGREQRAQIRLIQSVRMKPRNWLSAHWPRRTRCAWQFQTGRITQRRG